MKILVCPKCLRSSCWNGVDTCSEADTIDTPREIEIEALAEMGLESGDFWQEPWI